jgi:DNA (cytosine-5)-methyltransferase 1
VKRFTFADLFAGIGGMRVGFERAGGRCVFTSEWDKYCQLVYRANFAVDHPTAGDIRAVPLEDMPSFDVLVAGFPCQPFSIAGVTKKNALGRAHGFADATQGNLFFRIAAILDYHRPSAFLLENVRNLQRHDRGKTFNVIMNVLEERLGYHVSTRIIDARAWVPQHRERIFIAGFRDPVGFDLNDLRLPDPDAGPKMRAVLHSQAERPDGVYLVTNGRVNRRYTLTQHLWNYLQEYAQKHRRRGNGFGYGLVTPESVSRTLSARYYKDGSEILVAQRGRPPRRLTPRECARLMGFSRPNGDEWTIPVSDTQAYKQFGNAVVVPVVETIARAMAPVIHAAPETERDPAPQLMYG